MPTNEQYRQAARSIVQKVTIVSMTEPNPVMFGTGDSAGAWVQLEIWVPAAEAEKQKDGEG